MSEKRKILVLDDSEVDRTVLVLVLEKHGFEVVGLVDGGPCIETIDKEKPELVLLDIMLPDIDGRDLLKSIRERYSQIQLPVIMITAKADSADVIEALRLGANDYIAKPVDTEILLMRVGTQMRMLDLSRETVRLQEIAAIHAMSVTYNHEINNALAIAVLNVATALEKNPGDVNLANVKMAHQRISDVVKAITAASSRDRVVFESYVGSTKMIKVKQ